MALLVSSASRVRDHRVDVALPEIGELGSECGVICTVRGWREAGLRASGNRIQQDLGSRPELRRDPGLQEIQVGIIVGGGFGVEQPSGRLLTALLQSHGSSLRTACRMLAGGLARKVVGAIL